MLINKMNVSQTIKIVNAKGVKDSVNLQPNGRIEIPTGWSVDPNHAASYMSSVKDTDGSLAAALAKKSGVLENT